MVTGKRFIIISVMIGVVLGSVMYLSGLFEISNTSVAPQNKEEFLEIVQAPIESVEKSKSTFASKNSEPITEENKQAVDKLKNDFVNSYNIQR